MVPDLAVQAAACSATLPRCALGGGSRQPRTSVRLLRLLPTVCSVTVTVTDSENSARVSHEHSRHRPKTAHAPPGFLAPFRLLGRVFWNPATHVRLLAARRHPCPPPPPPPPSCPHTLSHPAQQTYFTHRCRIDDLPDDVLERVFVLAGQRY